MRWQAEVDCTWELETHHAGFESAEEAALFANGLAEVGVVDLQLERAELRLGLTDGSSMAMDPAAVTIWKLATRAADSGTATDADFSRIELVLAALSRRGLDGAFIPLAYGVLGTDRQPIDVTISFDDDLGTAEVNIVADADDDGAEPALLLFGVLPRA